MTSLRHTRALASNPILRRVSSTLALTVLLAVSVGAQQPAVGRQRSPRLTTDDVSRPPAEQPVVESKETAAKPDEAGKPAAAEGSASQPKTADAKVSPEESAWRDRVSKARDRAKESERVAEQAELRITSLRNDLGTSGESAKYRNETAAEMDQAGQRLKELRAEARAADDDLAELVEYGKQKGYAEDQGPKPTSDEGKPNEEYYRAQFAKLTEATEGAQRRIQLYENRVADISQRILMNGGKKGGDNFYIMQLQQDRDAAQQKLDEARAALTKAQTDLDNLKEEARRAGVAPGLFR